MPRYGFSGNEYETKILILFVMKAFSQKISLELLGEMVLLDDNADYFTFYNAVESLVENGLLENDGGLFITPKGYTTICETSDDISISMRKAAADAITQIKERLLWESCLKFELFEQNKEPFLKSIVTDGDNHLLEITLPTGNKSDAERMKKNFIKKSRDIYKYIIHSLMNNS